MSDTLWSRSDDWVGTEVDGSYVMVNIETGRYVSLNQSAAAIWQALEQPSDAAGIGAHLRERFDVADDECAAAVESSLATMQEMNLVAPRIVASA